MPHPPTRRATPRTISTLVALAASAVLTGCGTGTDPAPGATAGGAPGPGPTPGVAAPPGFLPCTAARSSPE